MDKEKVTTSIRDLPAWIYEELKKDAQENRRTINSELIFVLEQWAKKRS